MSQTGSEAKNKERTNHKTPSRKEFITKNSGFWRWLLNSALTQYHEHPEEMRLV
jgi:hypothetical protein